MSYRLPRISPNALGAAMGDTETPLDKANFEDADAAVNRLESEVRTNETAISPAEVLAMMPPGLRFHFLDEIQEIDETHVVARYRFRQDEFFYEGHFPERPITPGTVLLEAMCQCGVTVQSYYLLAREMSIEKARKYRILFTSAKVEWFEKIGPESLITLRSELLSWRRQRIRSRVKLFDEVNRLAAESEICGLGVLLDRDAAQENGANRPRKEFKIKIDKTSTGGAEHES
jgi:3-hydroxyacyl-[acyl-carrier-protein] dehydratase